MNILYIEPYYSGSHKYWINSYKEFSKHNIHILGLPGRKWKWRMHGGAVTLADEFNKLDKKFDLIICSDMLNLPVFKSLCNNIDNTKCVMYFHENQFSYPWSPNDPDIKLNIDLNYGYINYTSSLISDYNFFNSNYHKESYLNELKKYLNKMPDFQNKDSVDVIKNKSSVLHIGCSLTKSNSIQNQFVEPVILWNHRWEYDKNPDLFFHTLFDLDEMGIDYNLIVLGEQHQDYPKIFDEAKNKLEHKILHFGYCHSRDDYVNLLNQANIIPVTSNQDFFGISIIEAVSSFCFPILPYRLSYPELFDYNNNKINFYKTDIEFKNKLIDVINNIENYKKTSNTISSNIINQYDWSAMAKKYDSTFLKII